MTYRPDEDIILEWPHTVAPSTQHPGDDVPDPAEVRRLRAIEQRAREIVDVEVKGSPRQNVARYILGEVS